MSSSKQSAHRWCQPGQMMRSQLIYMGHSSYRLGPAKLIVQHPVHGNHRGLSLRRRRCFRQPLIAVMFSPMNLKMSMLTALMLLSNRRPASVEQICFAFQTRILKGLSLQ